MLRRCEKIHWGPKVMLAGTLECLFVGSVETFDAPDGRPLRTGIRKKPTDRLRLEIDGFPGDASAERDHHTRDKAVHLFSEEVLRRSGDPPWCPVASSDIWRKSFYSWSCR